MKIVFFIIFVFCFLLDVYSQTWERAFGFIPGREEGATTVCRLVDGNFIVSGRADDSAGLFSRIIKVTPSGDSLWSKLVIVPGSVSTYIRTSVSTAEGGFIIAGGCQLYSKNSKKFNPTAFTAKYDENGNSIWIYNYYNYGFLNNIVEIIKANDSGFICITSENLFKIDNSGIYQWHKPSSYYGVTGVYGFKPCDNNSYVGASTNFPYSGIGLLKINNSGDIIWHKHDILLLPSFIQLFSDKIFTFGAGIDTNSNYLILKRHTYDSYGNFILEKTLNISREEQISGLFLTINTNRFLISSGSRYITLDTFFCALRIVDSNMTIIKSIDLTTTAGFRGLYSAVMQDSNYLVTAGNISLHLGSGFEDFYVVKTDTNLNLLVSIGIKKLETETPDAYLLYQNYPNPFNPFTGIKFTLPKESFVKVEIFDITGRLTDKIVEKKMTAGTYEAVWNGTDKPSGIYFCKMTAGKYTKTIRMVMVK